MAADSQFDLASRERRDDAAVEPWCPASDGAGIGADDAGAGSCQGGASADGRFRDASAVPAMRLIRVGRRGADRHAPPVATMFVSGRGGAVRRLIGSAHRHVIGVRRDPQMGYGQPTEGIAESPAMMRVATDPDVAWYQMQPFRLALMVNGRLQSYIADLIYVRVDGSVHVREVKRSGADLADLEYVAKLEAVRRVLAGLGWSFRPWTLEDIRGTMGREVNTGVIYYDRAAGLDGLLPRFETLAAEHGEMTFGELADALDATNRNRARAAIHRLIMQGRVWADLDHLLEDWSTVRLRAAAPTPARPYA